MTIERFGELAEAYGAIERWPEPLQAAGRDMAEHPACAALLVEAETLDLRLSEWVLPVPSPALRRLVVASHRRRWILRARLWWSAIGIGTALAGGLAGSGAAFTFQIGHTPPAFEATAFGSLGARENIE